MRSLYTALVVLALSKASYADAPRVVVDTGITEWAVSRVMEGIGTPETLLPPGSDPHHHHLRPSQARAIARAGLLVQIAPELTPWLDRAMTGLESEARVLTLLDVPGQDVLGAPDSAGGDHDTHGDQDGHDHDTGQDQETSHDHAHAGRDPHAWLDPGNMQVWIGAIADALSDLDPDNAGLYRSNAAETGHAVEELAEHLADQLAPYGSTPLVVQHDAYDYLARAFGLTIIGSVSDSDATDPGAARLRELRRRITSANPPCIFTEPGASPAAAAAIADEFGLSLSTLDPLGSTVQPGVDFYPATMQQLADAIVACGHP